jgi:hypothetical protein
VAFPFSTETSLPNLIVVFVVGVGVGVGDEVYEGVEG